MPLQRLRDLEDPVAPELAEARELLRQSRPLEPSLARMQRVRAALTARVPPPAAVGAPLLVKAALVLLAVGVTVALVLWAQSRSQPRATEPVRREPAPAAGAMRQPPIPLIRTPDDTPRPGEPQGAPPPAPQAPLRPAVHALPPTVARAPARLTPHAPSQLAARAPLRSAPHAPQRAARAPLGSAPPLAVQAPLAQTGSPGSQQGAAPPAAPGLTPPPSGSEGGPAAPPPRVAPPEAPPLADIPDEVDPAEAALVLSATQLLRQRGEPARALVLLGEYQSRFPRGALQEEVLALNLECLLALSDRRAGAAARDYLQRYPGGRFRRFAAAAAARHPVSSPRQE